MKDILDTVNYIPGSRKWVYRARTVNVTCELLIEQFKNVTLYSKVTPLYNTLARITQLFHFKNSNARRCIPNIGHCPLEWKYTNDSLQCSSYTSYVIDPVTNQVSDIKKSMSFY